MIHPEWKTVLTRRVIRVALISTDGSLGTRDLLPTNDQFGLIVRPNNEDALDTCRKLMLTPGPAQGYVLNCDALNPIEPDHMTQASLGHSASVCLTRISHILNYHPVTTDLLIGVVGDPQILMEIGNLFLIMASGHISASAFAFMLSVRSHDNGTVFTFENAVLTNIRWLADPVSAPAVAA